MTRTVVRASSSSAFLALVPRLLECTPRESLVLVPFTEGRSLGAMRVDLPGDASGDGDRVASTVIGMACKVADTDAIAVVVYTDEAVAAAGLPHRALADAIIARADICGLRVIDALTVGPDGWDSYLDPSPAGPHALADITAHDADPRVRPGNDQVSAAALPDAAPQAAAALARLLADVDALLGRARDRGKLPSERRSAADATMTLVSDPPALFEQAVALPADEIDPLQLAALAFCLERPALRDVALMQWAADASTGDAVLRAQTEYLSSRLFPADLASPMWGEGRRPDADRLRSALEVCRRVAATVPRRRRPGALSACAWLAWAQGRSSHAGTYAEAALAIDSRHGLSTIMLGLLDAGHLPEWVFERPTSRGGRGSSRGSRGR